MGAGGSCGLVCCWWNQAQEKVTGESLLLVSISPVSESWILCTPPTHVGIAGAFSLSYYIL